MLPERALGALEHAVGVWVVGRASWVVGRASCVASCVIAHASYRRIFLYTTLRIHENVFPMKFSKANFSAKYVLPGHLPFPPMLLAHSEFLIGSLRYGDYGLRTTARRALSFVRNTGLSRANIER